MVTTPIPYFGAKTRLADTIVSLLPRHGHYVEPFGGSLAVLLAKPRSAAETVNDADGALVAFWRMLRDEPAELARRVALTPLSRLEHAECGGYTRVCVEGCTALHGAAGHSKSCDLETARRVYVALTQGRAGRRHTGNGWRTRISGGQQPISHMMDLYYGRLLDAAERIQGVAIENMHAVDLVERYDDPDVLLYVDPPYTLNTRAGAAYAFEMLEPEQHELLAEVLNETAAAVVLSSYRSTLYDRLYDGWYTYELPTVTQQGNRRKPVCEVLWSNRPFAHHVQEPLFEGAAQ
jgi:DNA adenine methylase